MQIPHSPVTSVAIVRNFIRAVESSNPRSAAHFLDELFIFSGWTPKPLDKSAFLGVFARLKEGIPDLAWNLQHVHPESEQTVTGTIQITGHQTESFIIPELGLPPIPQTDSHISLPSQPVTFQLQRTHISAMRLTPVHDGNIHGLLRQLGIEMPIIQ